MSVQLLDKTRKINKLLHNNNSSKVVFNDICQVLTEILDSNILVISRKGKVLGVSLCPGVEEIKELIDDEVGGYIDSMLNERLLGVLSTKENVNLETLGFVGDNIKKYQAIINPIDIAVAPFLLLISSSLSSEAALAQYGYGFWPKEFSLNAYTYLFKSSMKIAKGYGITLIVTLVGTTLSVLITTLFAYPLSRKELPFRYGFSFFVFFTMLFNGGLVPSYMMWTQTFHIKNTIWALIMPNLLLNAFYVIMMRSFFTSSIPDALIEAARIDGAGEYKILARVVIPLSKPMMATISLMVGLGYWNDWTNSLYYITDESLFSIQAILNTIITNIQFLTSGQSSAASAVDVSKLPSVSIRMAIAVIGVLPVLCIYPFFQKYFVKGIVVGGVKG